MNLEKTLPELSFEQRQLVVENHAFAKKLSFRFRRSAYRCGYTVEELESAASYGLVVSALRYREAEGSKFSTYAYMRVNGEIRDLLRGKRRKGAQTVDDLDAEYSTLLARKARMCALAEAAGYVGYDIQPSPVLDSFDCSYADAAGPEDILVKQSACKVLRKLLNALAPTAAFVIEQYYFCHKTIEEIRQELGVQTRGEVFRMHRKALKALKKELHKRSLGFDDFLSIL